MAVIHCQGTIQGTKVIFEHKNDKEFDNILFQLNETRKLGWVKSKGGLLLLLNECVDAQGTVSFIFIT